ncbi:MAG: polysaccharide export protein [Betaproteobacteria bacterium]|nr:polysaccharide export protein [Betaproteobacteria bacterium]
MAPTFRFPAIILFAAAAAAVTLSGCAYLPTSGPSTKEVEQSALPAAANAIQIVEVDDAVTRRLLAQRKLYSFSEMLGDAVSVTHKVGNGDVLEVSIWEAPPATLFGVGTLDARGTVSGVRATVLPEQVVNSEGYISVPFAGRIPAAGKTLQAIEADVVKRLTGKANQPEALVRLTRNSSSSVTVVGEVTHSIRVPITPSNERLLDVLAAADGVKQPVNKTTIQVTRGRNVYSLPLDTIIRDPLQNVRMQAGDVVTAMFQPLSFTALGATGKNEEINFEAQGITLAQALARAGGLQDSRSDAKGVFIFRFEPADALKWPRQPVMSTPDGMVPVIYRIDLRNPASFFVMQSFAINNKDLLYVTNAPAVELQKFLNVVFSVAYPVLTVVQVTK